MKVKRLFSSVLVLLSILVFILVYVPASVLDAAAQVTFDSDKWPTNTGAPVNSSPVLGDLDGDGFLEIVVGSDNGKVYIWKADGTLLPGWPTNTEKPVRSTSALADLDGDGKLDVIVGSFDSKMYAWNASGKLLKGWPAATGSVIYSSPAIGDVDGDQAPEVVAGSFDNKVYVWNADGTVARGWPQPAGLFVYSSAALADLDGDDRLEIIIGSDNNRLFVWNGDGIPLSGWPQVTGHVVPTSPAVGDIDGDGDLDIIAGSWDKVYVWDSHGKSKKGWPINVGSWVTSSPALADLNNDGFLDIIVGSKEGKVFAWNARSELLDGWPTVTDGEVSSSPSVGDIDGDGRLDVAVGSKDNKLYIWDVNGRLLPGWPKATGGSIASSPAMGDLDKDGNIEIVVGSKDGKVYVWSVSNIRQEQTPPNLPWPFFHRDSLHTGLSDYISASRLEVKTTTPEGESGSKSAPGSPGQVEVQPTSKVVGQDTKSVAPGVSPKTRFIAKELIDDLTISEFTDTSVTLNWTAPSVKENPAKFYDIRFSTEPITDETWNSATKYTTDLRPSPPNQKEAFTLFNLPNREKLYLALRASDGKEKTKVSNVVELDRTDSIPPGIIKDLTVVEKGDQLEVSWTAPGDNENEGAANGYDLRYVNTSLDEASWVKAIEVVGEPKPLPAGTKQQFSIPKPASTENLYFGIKTVDEALNVSSLSNIAIWTPQDFTPPAKIQDLKVEGITPDGIALAWTAPGNDGNIGRVFRYDIRYSESEITDTNWSSIKNLIIGPIPEPAGTLQRFLVKESLVDKVYHFAMKAIDARNNESPLSNTVQVDLRDKVPPARIRDLAIIEVGNDWAQLSWTASGDNGTEGNAAVYSLKYSEDPEILRSWDQAQEATNLPKPLPSGSKQAFKLSGLKSNVRYYVGIKGVDAAGNYSEPSNIIEIKTSDTVNPAPITDLRVTGSTEDSLTLSWTATGDDGQTGKAAQYDLRYTIKNKLTPENWDQATKITGLPQPSESGSPERYIVRNLSRATTYYFAIEALDKQGNRSGLSNVLEVSTADMTPPAAVKDLGVVGTGADWVKFSWSVTGDDGMEGNASFYTIRYAESSETIRQWDRATEVPNTIKPGDSGNKEEFLIGGLKSNTVYYIALKVGDDRGNLSDLSNILQIKTNDNINPAPVADLKITASTEDSVVLSWTATGDNGLTGKAAAYDLRFTQGTKLTKETWISAYKVEGLPQPAESGTPETFSITGLSKGTPYYFAIEAIDGQGNRSGLSNVAEIATKDITPPAPIKDLAVAQATGNSVELAWTATGNDALEGRAAVYSLKYALDRKTLQEWNQATEAYNVIKPATAGQKEAFTLTGLKSNTVYYIGLKVIDEAVNTSGLSNVVQVKTTDALSPDPIVDLKVVTSTETSTTLSWTATGDDGKSGRATTYDLRYTVGEKLTKDNWAQAQKVTGLPQPGEAGKTETYTVTGLSKNIPYYFAIEASDVQGNRSGLSNVIETSTADTLPPATIKDLVIVGSGPDWIRIAWTATGDDGMEGKASSYFLRYAQDIQTIREWDRATELSNTIKPGVPGEREEFLISGLKSNTIYYIAIKVVDDRGNFSGLSNVAQAGTTDTINPSPIADLRVSAETADSVTLSWTATGDDGRVGKAVAYDLRFTQNDKLTKETWLTAHKIESMPQPADPGTLETFNITGLSKEITYYFAIEVIDKQGNRSGLSNVVTVSPADTTSPATVQNLTIVGTGADWIRLTWTATGDDRMEGRAASYLLRYAESAQAIREWDQATEVLGMIRPGNPGEKEEFVITGTSGANKLKSNSTYYIGLKVLDDRGNESGLSNIVQGRTGDAVNPAAITDLRITESTEDSITLSWTAAGDDGRVGQANEYDLRYTIGEKLSKNLWPLANRVEGLPKPQESGHVEIFKVTGLQKHKIYYFALETIDKQGNRSDISNILEARTQDITPPAGITDLSVVSTSADSVKIRWTATGDDGTERLSARYSLRIALDLKTLEAWEQAVEIPGVPKPSSSGTEETFTISGLSSNTTYYIGLKAFDGQNNTSIISNILRTRTADTIKPALITDLAPAEINETAVTLKWTATGDDGKTGRAERYELKYVVDGTLTTKTWQNAILVSSLPQPSEVGTTEIVTIPGLSRDMKYHFAMEAIDGAGNRSGLSNIVEVTTPDLAPPAAITDLKTMETGPDWVRLSWTATGDDGNEGVASRYTLRYATDLKTLEEWEKAVEVPKLNKPKNPGSPEEFLLKGLKSNVAYYIGIKVADNRQNYSTLSNIVELHTMDTVNPAAVGDLHVTGSTEDSITLSWMATGDDNRIGQANEYDLRYVVGEKLTKTNWKLAQRVSELPKPQSSGNAETYRVAGLSRDTTYYFALEVSDRQGNRSGLSNIIEANTRDATPPAAVVDLSTLGAGADWVKVSWTATGDDGTEGQATSYSLKYTSDLKVLENWDQALEVPGVPKPSLAGTKEEFTITGLKNNSVYYVAIKVMDNRQNLSPFSNILKVQTADTINPAPVTDLRVEGPPIIVESQMPQAKSQKPIPGRAESLESNDQRSLSSTLKEMDTLTLAWTATGDDDRVGRAAQYDLRYSTTPIIEKNWASAQKVSGLPAPAEAGTPEKFTVRNLVPNQTYYIALVVTDKNGNASLLSNILEASTADTIAPKVVNDLSVEDTTDTTVSLVWTSVGDDAIHNTAVAYDLRYTTSTITEANWAQATKISQMVVPSPIGNKEKQVITNLRKGISYYFAIKSLDKASNVSPLSSIAHAYTLPGRVTDLAVSSAEAEKVVLTWTAPGGDLSKDRIYEIRYARQTITDDTWSQATLYPAQIKAKYPGIQEKVVLTNLPPDEKLFFAVKLFNTRLEVAQAKPEAEHPSTTDKSQITSLQPSTSAQEATKPGTGPVRPEQPASPEGSTSTIPPAQVIASSQLPNVEVSRVDIIPPAAIVDLSIRPVSCSSSTLSELSSNLENNNDRQTAGNKSGMEEEQPGSDKVKGQGNKKGKKGLFSFLRPKSNDKAKTGKPVTPTTMDNGQRTLNNGCLELSWTATGDNRNEGFATNYDIRYARAPLTEVNWSRATRYTEVPKPQISGTREVFVVPLPSQEETFYFAVRIMDEALNLSPLSNMVSWTPPDYIPPSTIVDLKVTGVDERSVSLSWTAPGNNENRGQAAFYDMRYSESRSILEGWSRAQIVQGEPLPEIAGTLQSMNITNLIPDTTYYIALTTTDEAKNTSSLSSVVEVTMPDLTPPYPVKDLTLVGIGIDRLKIAWTATGDDGKAGQAFQYSLKYATGKATLENWDSIPEAPHVPKPKSSGKKEEILLTGLTSNTTYYIGLKVIDNRSNYSGLSNILEARTGDALSPEMITDLKVIGSATEPESVKSQEEPRKGKKLAIFKKPDSPIGNEALTLAWTATGDDGKTGRADRYDLRYALEPLDLSSWDKAIKVKDMPKPSEAGTTENLIVRGLAPNKKYYFGVVALDKEGNASSLSNVAEGLTRDTIPPQPIRDLQVESATKDTVTLTWTSSGDDPLHDQAQTYDLRYSTQPLDETNWEAAEKAIGIQQPGKVGTLERFTLGGTTPLQESTSYYFAVKGVDGTGNVSPLSNVVSTQTKDVTPPVSIGDLVAAYPTLNVITLLWTAPKDPNTGGAVSSYDIRYWEVKEPGSGVEKETLKRDHESSLQHAGSREQGGQGTPGIKPKSKMVPATKKPTKNTKSTQAKQTSTLTAPTGQTAPVVPVRAQNIPDVKPDTKADKDKSINPTPSESPVLGGQIQRAEPEDQPFSTEDNRPDVSGSTPSSSQLEQAQGSTPSTGSEQVPGSSMEQTPSLSTGSVSQLSIPFPWEKATKVLTSPQPAIPGSLEKLIVTNLKEGQTYAFAIRSIDQSGNVSELSNVVFETTLGLRSSLAPARSSQAMSTGQEATDYGQWSTYQGKGTILLENGSGSQVTSTDVIFGLKRPVVISYPSGSNTLSFPQDQLSIKIKSRDPFTIYVKILSAQKDEYYLAYQASPIHGLSPTTIKQGQQADNEPSTTDNGQQTTDSESRTVQRIDNFVFFQLSPEFLDGTLHSLERNLRDDLFNATGQAYVETKWFAARGSHFSIGDVHLSGRLVRMIPVNQGWGVHYGEGEMKLNPDSELNAPVLQAKSRNGRDLIVAYPTKPGIQFSEKFLTTKIKAKEEFKFFVKVVTTDGEAYYLTYLPRDGSITLSGNYIYVPIGSSYRDGTWHKLERNLETDLQKALAPSGQSVANYSYTNWISIGGREFNLDNIEFSTDVITAKIPK